jgi:hypothetical protein
MNNAKEIAEKVIETQNRLDDIHSKLGIVSRYDEIVVIARAYLELEKQFEAALVEIQHLKENNNVPAHMLKFGLKEGVEYE